MEDLAGMSLLVHGKGNKDRMVPLCDGLARELSVLLRGYFFPGGHKGHICSDTAYALVKKGSGWPRTPSEDGSLRTCGRPRGMWSRCSCSLATSPWRRHSPVSMTAPTISGRRSMTCSHTGTIKGCVWCSPRRSWEAYGLTILLIVRILAGENDGYRQDPLFCRLMQTRHSQCLVTVWRLPGEYLIFGSLTVLSVAE